MTSVLDYIRTPPRREWVAGDVSDVFGVRWFEIGGSWHIIIDPPPSEWMATTVCRYNPPTLVVERRAVLRLPDGAVPCLPCYYATRQGKRIEYVDA